MTDEIVEISNKTSELEHRIIAMNNKNILNEHPIVSQQTTVKPMK